MHSNVFAIPKTSHIQRVIENSKSIDGWNATDKDSDETVRVYPFSGYDIPLEMI